ncbi:hypothetical protein EDEG_03768 [Edhazardia aedis USNM 41457]|uniref:Uncharacterized protein n=1 Tax=Edhazardia aedis (strain USNM 41457) TaxID=1003232 RepID=J9D1J1_EDHAE|nr:hypothetical protein EDEG_03768 [Edhazardia aedis USNM 41457]|eukprot:EJW01706.1 hypothetical protein EDEG_03768 [Edhazardia aedis USNM 41457]
MPNILNIIKEKTKEFLREYTIKEIICYLILFYLIVVTLQILVIYIYCKLYNFYHSTTWWIIRICRDRGSNSYTDFAQRPVKLNDGYGVPVNLVNPCDVVGERAPKPFLKKSIENDPS